MVRCACGLEAVIRTSWTNRNPGRRFYGCPTLSPTCVNFLRWYDPPMCQRSVQIILGLLRSRNELEEILAMVEEKRRKLLKFLIISWICSSGGTHADAKGKSQQAIELFQLTTAEEVVVTYLLKDQLLVYFDLKTQREVQLATEINNLTRQLLDIIDERRSFIGELEQRLPTNVMAYKTRQELKCHQKDDMIRAIEMRSIALQLHH
ncbi:zinc finger, GRF-type containing protein [Tanacetum coccineum]